MNSAQVTGRLIKDPVVRVTKTGKQVASFILAVNTRFSGNSTTGGANQEKTAWIPVVAWGYLAEEVKNKLHKGSYVLVEGRIDTRSWDDDKQQRHWVTEINARVISIPFSRRADGQSIQQQNGQWRDSGWSSEGAPQVPPYNGQTSDPGNFSRFGVEDPPKRQMAETTLGFPAGNEAADVQPDEIPF